MSSRRCEGMIRSFTNLVHRGINVLKGEVVEAAKETRERSALDSPSPPATLLRKLERAEHLPETHNVDGDELPKSVDSSSVESECNQRNGEVGQL